MAVRPLTVALRKRAEKEIENNKRVPSDVTAFKEWLRKQPHLESVWRTDQWLVAFLRGGKFSLERSKEKLEMYYTPKSVVPEFFARSQIRLYTYNKYLGVFLPLKKCKEEDAPRVCIMREVVVDMKNAGIGSLSQWTPALAKKVVSCFEKALPLRMRDTHILNTPRHQDLKQRIELECALMTKTGIIKLPVLVPKKLLPIEYGGSDGTLEELRDYWKAKVESYRDWFVQQEAEKTDKAKRPGNPKNSSILFGVEGYSRKLEVD